MTGPPDEGRDTFWRRLTRGTRRSWVSERHRRALPDDLVDTVMSIDSRDRLHAKQGRSTARVVFHGPDGPVPVYLKRHYRLPWPARLAALFDPHGRHTPGAQEHHNLARATATGVPVPEAVAAGEWVGPWGRLQSFLMIAELTGWDELNVALPVLKRRLNPPAFERLKRGLVREAAGITARLHAAGMFHKDLYLCHFFLDSARLGASAPGLMLIDLHRLGVHRLWPDRWRWKDLGQLLYSTHGVAGIDGRDVLRFWVHYRRAVPMRRPRWQARMVAWKAGRYRKHNGG